MRGRVESRPTFIPNTELWAPQTVEEQERDHNAYHDHTWYLAAAANIKTLLGRSDVVLAALPHAPYEGFRPIPIDKQIEALAEALKEVGL